ncbi:MFS transporter [Streptomyces sp. NPDC057137]|uniref:MFS transporter n=1 Tax=Streptomyces sp. NPDC057137 TaxID=3346030 RepID=UPI0036268539
MIPEADTPAPASAPARPAYRDPNVLRWLGAYTTSVTGDIVYFLALTWAVTQESGPAQAGAVLAAGAVPRAVLMLAGGVVADRFGPRRVVIGSDLVRCVVILAAATVALLIGTELWLLVALAVVFGSVDALFMPAVGALPPRIAATDQLARVQGLRLLSVRLSNTVGPPLAAVALSVSGSPGAFGVAGALFVVSLVLLLAVRVRPLPSQDVPGAAGGSDESDAPDAPAAPDATTSREEFRDGLRYLRANGRVSSLVVVIGLGEMCFSGPVGTGLVLLADERDWGTATAGWILSAFSIGGAVASLLLSVLRRVPRAGLTMSCALLLTAALVVATGNAPTAGLSIGLGALLGTASGAAMVVSNALLQKETDPRYLGRVTSVMTLCTLGLSPLLYPLVGLVAAGWGIGAFFAGCGAICLLAAGTGLLVRSVRTATLTV